TAPGVALGCHGFGAHSLRVGIHYSSRVHELMNLFRTHSFRPWLIIALVVLLCAGLLLFSGNSLATLVAVFTFLAALLSVVSRSIPQKLLRITDPATRQAPARAPPAFSL